MSLSLKVITRGSAVISPDDPAGPIAAPDALGRLLRSSRPDFAAVVARVRVLGDAAVPILLDALATASDRSTRRDLLRILASLGPAVGAATMARLRRGGEWYVQRNLLALIGMLPAIPDMSVVARLADHGDPRVRQQAIRLLLRDPATRDQAVCQALAAPDERSLRLGLTAARERCPPEAVDQLIAMAKDEAMPLRAQAVHALASAETAKALDGLWDLAVERGGWLSRERVRPSSPVVLAALAVLAERWPTVPRVRRLLLQAARHPSSGIRAVLRSHALEKSA
jgi:HEAT repeat protein